MRWRYSCRAGVRVICMPCMCSMRAVFTIPLLVGPLVAACEDPLTPADLAGNYALQSEDGQSLPRLLSATVNCDVFLTGGALALNVDRSFVLDLREQLDCSRAGGPIQDAGRTYPGTFTIHGRQIQFTSPRFGEEPITFSGTVLGGTVSLVIVDPGISAWGHLKPTLVLE